MSDADRTRDQLIAELAQLRRQIANLERSETKREKAEEQLRSSHEMYKQLAEAARDLMFVISSDGTVLYTNSHSAKYLGISPDQIVGLSIDEYFPHEIASVQRRELEEVLRTGEPASFEDKATFPIGDAWIDTSLVPLKDESGTVYAVLGVSRDITARKHAEQALRESEERFRTLLETTSEVVWEADDAGVYSYVSPRVCDLLGYLPHELVGKRPFDFMPKDEAQRVAALFYSIAADRRPFKGLINTNRRKDGQLVVLESSGVPFFDVNGNFRGYRGIDRDVTERKEAERLREEYLSLVSHDLKSPLSVITGQSSWLLRSLQRKGLERDASSAEAILKSAKRMDAMLVDLVESARLESGRMEMVKEPEDLTALVTEVSSRVGSPEDRDRIQVESISDLPPIPLDPERIERVLVNLLTNALKYGGTDTPILVQVGADDLAAVVAVSDQGPGIPVEDHLRVFDRFYQVATNHRLDGLGLGLYIARLIVEAHGGNIWVDSIPGKGSTFYFSLPMA